MAEHLFLDDLPLYALGALTGEDRRRLEAHLQDGCDLCETELVALGEATSLLPYSVPEIPLPSGLRSKVLARVGAEDAEVRSREMPARSTGAGLAWGLALAASLVLAASLAGLWLAARKDNATFRADASRLDMLLKDQEKELAWLKDPLVQVALLKGLEANPQAKAKLLWHPGSRQGILYIEGLPPLPLEKSYELWAFVGEQPVPAGVFDARPGGLTVFPISRQESLGEEPTKFAVSIEPKGGVKAPTGAIVLVGERF